MRRMETEQRLIHLYDMTIQDQTVSQNGIKYKIINAENKYHVFPSSTNNLFPYPPTFVNYFHAVQNQYMLHWLLKDAQLTCNRCPFETLLTPFWSPIKHLFLHCLITNWFTAGCKPVFYTYSCLYLQVFYPKLCHDFSIRRLPFQSIDMKRFSALEDDNKVGSQDSLDYLFV